MHTTSSSGATVNHGGRMIPGVSNDFHVYALEWTPEKMIFSVDSLVHYIYFPSVRDAATWPFDDPQYLLLNFAIEGGIDPSFTEDTLEIDYLRVYQAPSVGMQEVQNKRADLYPNPVADQLRIEIPEANGSWLLELRAQDGRAENLDGWHVLSARMGERKS